MKEKIKLGRMESAFLAEMVEYGLRHMEDGVGTHKADNLMYGAEGFEINSLIEKFQQAFDLEASEWTTIERIRQIIDRYRVSNGKGSRKNEPYFNENLTPEIAYNILDLHVTDMMDCQKYKLTPEVRSEIIRVFGGTFRYQRGEMIKELLDVLKEERKLLLSKIEEVDNGQV